MRVELEEVKLIPDCTIAFGYGTFANGEAITFAGDHRMMANLQQILAEKGQTLPVDIESWQIWTVGDE